MVVGCKLVPFEEPFCLSRSPSCMLFVVHVAVIGGIEVNDVFERYVECKRVSN